MGKIITSKGVKTGEGTVSHDNDISQTVSSAVYNEYEGVETYPMIVNNTGRGLLSFNLVNIHSHILVIGLPKGIVLPGQTTSTHYREVAKIATLG